MPASFSLKQELLKLRDKYAKAEGTTDDAATRDMLTDLMHIAKDDCDESDYFDTLLEGAREVFVEEAEEEQEQQPA